MNMSPFSPIDSLVISRPQKGVLALTLNRAQRKNALDRELVIGLGDAFSLLEQDESIRVVLLQGAGGAFCAGADLSTIENAGSDELEGRINEFHRIILGIVEAKVPIIAVIDGPAVGFGADIALACDLRIMSERAYLEESFAKIGLMPDGGGTLWLSQFVGPRAFEYLALGTRLDAPTCQEWGIANHVVSCQELENKSLSMAEKLASSAPLAIRALKLALRAGIRSALRETLEREKRGQIELIQSADFSEGVAAFLGKRAPEFLGN